MLYDYAAAGRGLKLVVISVLVGIGGGLLLWWVPFAGTLLEIACAAIAAYGFYLASKGHPDYTIAMYLRAAGVAISLLHGLLGGVALVGSLLLIAGIVCDALTVNIVCNATDTLLDACGKPVNPAGAKVWKLYVVCALIMAVLTVVSSIPLIGALAGVLTVPTAIVSFLASILYFVFLWKAQDRLQAA